MDIAKYIKKYEELVVQIETVCEKVKSEHSERVTCKPGCSDCCHALFDLTLIEAVTIKQRFDEKFTGKLRHDILTVAGDVDRKIFKIKKNATEAEKLGTNGEKIIERISQEKIACPLLDENNHCRMYDHRPIACRVYGIPTSTGGKGYTCGLSGFTKGENYPTLNMDIVYKRLYDISNEMIRDIKSKYTKMGDILVPLSMCLTLDYNEEYFGIPGLEIIG